MGYAFNPFTGNFDNTGTPFSLDIGDSIGGTPANGGILYADSSDTLRANHWSTGTSSYAGGAVTGIKFEQQVIADAPRFEVLNLSGFGIPNAFALATSTDPFSFFLTDTDTLTTYVAMTINPATPASSNVTFGLASGTSSNPEFALTTTSLGLRVPVDMNTNKITELDTPTAGGDAVNKTYADAIIPSQTGNSGKYLTTNGSAVSWGTVTASPGGSNTQVQFNNSGAFGGSAGLTWNGSQIVSTAGYRMGSGSGNSLRDNDGNGSVYFDGNATHIYGYGAIKFYDGVFGQYADFQSARLNIGNGSVDTAPFGGGNYDVAMTFGNSNARTPYDQKAFGAYFAGKVIATANGDLLVGNAFHPIFTVGSYTGLTQIGTIFITPNANAVGTIFQGASSQAVDLVQLRNSSGAVLSSFAKNAAWKPPSLADSAAENNTVYYSTDASKLVYKDAGGTVNNLY